MRTNFGSHFRRYFYPDGLELKVLENRDDLEGPSLRNLLATEFNLHVWPLTPAMRDLNSFNI
jgi:hypothetical protein